VSQAWDLDGDGAFDDARGAVTSRAFSTAGRHTVRLRVVDAYGATDVESRTVVVRAPAAPASPKLQLISPFPVVRIVGTVTKRGARIKLLSVRAPTGARVSVSCRGRSCPYRSAAHRAGTGRVAFRGLRRYLRAGTTLVVRVSQGDRIGKYTRFRIRRGRRPARTDLCLMPGAESGSGCPSD
jgi:hypothetical protein